MVGPYVLPSDLSLLWLPMTNFTSFCIHWFLFFFFFRDTQGWFNLMETLDHLPAAASSVGERGPRSHRVTARWCWALGMTKPLWCCCPPRLHRRGRGPLQQQQVAVFSPIPTGRWEKGARLFQPLLFVPALGLASHPLLPTDGKFEGPSPGTR